MSGKGHLSEGHAPHTPSPGKCHPPSRPSLREGRWGLNFVNGSALAILVVRGAAERLFATLCVPGFFCFVLFF